jgi:hypothetical protein
VPNRVSLKSVYSMFVESANEGDVKSRADVNNDDYLIYHFVIFNSAEVLLR